MAMRKFVKYQNRKMHEVGSPSTYVSMDDVGAVAAAGDDVEFYLTREDGAGTDTMAASVLIHSIVFQYADA